MSHQEPQPQATSVPRQVAVIAVRCADGGLEVCLIRRKDSRAWGIPKGFIDPGDTPEQAALTEASEEAGLMGRLIGDAIGTYDYKKRSANFTVAVYVMEVLEEQVRWREMRLRERRWHSLEDAAVLLATHPVASLWDLVRKSLSTWC